MAHNDEAPVNDKAAPPVESIKVLGAQAIVSNAGNESFTSVVEKSLQSAKSWVKSKLSGFSIGGLGGHDGSSKSGPEKTGTTLTPQQQTRAKKVGEDLAKGDVGATDKDIKDPLLQKSIKDQNPELMRAIKQGFNGGGAGMTERMTGGFQTDPSNGDSYINLNKKGILEQTKGVTVRADVPPESSADPAKSGRPLSPQEKDQAAKVGKDIAKRDIEASVTDVQSPILAAAILEKNPEVMKAIQQGFNAAGPDRGVMMSGTIQDVQGEPGATSIMVLRNETGRDFSPGFIALVHPQAKAN